MKTILFQGDSITDANRSRTDDDYLGQGYPEQIAAEMGYEHTDYKFINRGISGNRIVDVYARIKADIINIKPDVMSILIGVNDVWHEVSIHNGVDADKFFKIYCMLIEEIKQSLPDIQIIIMAPYIMYGPATAEHWDTFRTEVDKRAEKAKEVAEKYNLSFVNLQDKFDEALKRAPLEHWSTDGVHPTKFGHQIIKKEWEKAYKALK